jgi:hypothetical protein
MVEKLSLVLGELQTSIDVPEPALAANDFIDVVEAYTADVSPDSEADNRGSGMFDQRERTLGKTEVEIGLTMALYSMGGTSESAIIKLFRAAGFERILDTGMVVLRPRSEIVDAMTFWTYKGGPGTNRSIRTEFGNVMFDWVIRLEAAKRALAQFTGVGLLDALPVRATQPNVEAYRERQVAPAIKAATVSINGVAYQFVRCEISGNQAPQNTVDAAHPYGGGFSEITDRNIEFTATVYAKPIASQVPHTNLYAKTSGTLDFQFGTFYGNPDVRIYAAAAFLDDVKNGDENGVSTWDIKGYIERNLMEVRIYKNIQSSESSSSDSMSSDSNSSSSSSVSASSTSSSSISQ